MSVRSTARTRQREAGIALLISIFILLLISVVAIALVVSSGTESALAGNYRSATGVYYAALSGLEEARGRLLSKNPDAFKTTDPTFLPASGSINMGDTYYLINPIGGEVITPWDLSSTYPDTQFAVEFGSSGFAAPTNPSKTALSVWNKSPLNALNLPGPLYKWVRINAVSEKSLRIDFDGNPNSTTPLYYDGAHFSNSPSAGPQVLELTALAVLPNGSQKLLQYLVAPNPIALPPFPAAITLLGNNVDYTGPNQTSWLVTGNDTIDLGSCTHGSNVWAIGYYNNVDTSKNNITASGAVATSPYKNNYTGQGGTIPNVGFIGPSIPPSLQKPSDLETLATGITQNADVVRDPSPAPPPGTLHTFTGSDLPTTMSPTNPLTIVVHGNLDLTGWHNTGYGLLLVTGTLNYDPDASWYGIVLLIGQGTMTGSHSCGGGNCRFVGAIFLAKTRDLSNNVFPDPNLPSAGGPGFTPPDARSYGSNIQFSTSMGGNGVFYSSCWIQAATPAGSAKILSFHEISQ
jgi:hypothetical protein